MELYNSHTDEYLFSLLQKSDEKAFTELYERYWKKLLVRANFLLSSQEDAEEVVHDIFVTLWRQRVSLHIRHSFYTYVAAMLKYGCFKIMAKRRSVGIMETTGLLLTMDVADSSTEEWLDFNDLRDELESAVSRLPGKCQLIFRLSREECMSNQEIALKLDLSVNTVRTQMHRALQQLKTSIGSFFCL